MTSIGLVLGGGGITGFAYHTAILGVLQRQTGWDPRTADLILGTSAGANIGGLLRGNVPVGQALDRILTVPTNPRSMARLRELSGRDSDENALTAIRFAPAAPTLAIRELTRGFFARPSRIAAGLIPRGRLRTEVIGDRAAELHHQGWPDSALWLPSVRLSDGERIVFGRDRIDVGVGTATEASSAIPGFFRPVPIDGDRYVDGGIHSATNADLVVGHDFDLVVIISPLSVASLGIGARSSNGAMRLWCREVLRREANAIREDGAAVLIIEPGAEEVRAMGPTLMDPTRVVDVVLQASSAARLDLADEKRYPELELLRQASKEQPAPVDVAYPE